MTTITKDEIKNGTSDKELMNMVAHLPRSFQCRFLGIVSKDQLGTMDWKPDTFAIMNIENSKDWHGRPLDGTHWVSLGMDKRGNSWYYDSYGLPYPEEVKPILKGAITYPIHEMQGFESNLCGFYALGACLAIAFKKPFVSVSTVLHEYADLFDEPYLSKNDSNLFDFLSCFGIKRH